LTVTVMGNLASDGKGHSIKKGVEGIEPLCFSVVPIFDPESKCDGGNAVR
jgi:hypothetical protein